MKKVIALGVSALSAASLLVGVVGIPAAQAEEPPTLSEQVCDLVPETLTEIAGALSTATDALAAATSAVEDTKAVLDDAVVAYVVALVDWIDAVDTDPGVASSKLGVMNARFGDLVNAVVAWGEALTDQFDADVAAKIANLRGSLVDRLELGLECVPI